MKLTISVTTSMNRPASVAVMLSKAGSHGMSNRNDRVTFNTAATNNYQSAFVHVLL